jgi:hypothetical protein
MSLIGGDWPRLLNALAPDVVAGISYPAQNGFRIYLRRHWLMNAKQEAGLETPAFRTSIARDVAAVRINRDGEESVVAALEEIRLDSVGICFHGECRNGETWLLLSVAGHPERKSGSCVSALPPGAVTLREWAGALWVSHGERDQCIQDGEQKDGEREVAEMKFS